MRITHHGIVDQVISNLQDRLVRMNKAQEQVGSGLRVNRPSDDPSAAAQILNLESRISRATQYRRNIDAGLHQLRSTESAVGRVRDLLVQARAVAVQGSNGALTADQRQNLATQVDALLGELISLANERSDRSYLFGGAETRQAPYQEITDDSGKLIDVHQTFTDAPQPMELILDENDKTPVNLGAADVFDLGGGDSLFTVLFDLRNALNTNDPTAAGDVLPRLDAARDQMDSLSVLVGERVKQAQDKYDALGVRSDEMTKRASDLGDIDFAEAITRLTEEQNSYQLALSTAAKAIQLSLVNFL